MSDLNKIVWPGWETVSLIGRGSFGAVYKIQRDVFGDLEEAALKVISVPQNASDIDEMYGDGYDDESITSTFQAHLKSIVAEYSLMRKMNGSANIVNCDDMRYVQHDNGIGWDIFIKMELLTPLIKALPADYSEETTLKIARDLCAALELCKKYDIVHRDIKPQNIFVSPNGDYKLGDFGIAKTVEKTMGGTKIGTYKYMAPEVYNNQPYGTASDIYSLGLVLYWLLNERRMPFLPLPPAKLSAGMDEEARHRRLSGEKLPAPKNGSRELKEIVLKACAYDPKDRYQSAREMSEDLTRLSGGNMPVADVQPPEKPEPVQDVNLPEEAAAGPVFDRNTPPVQDDQDKTVGPVFTRQTTPEELDKTVGPSFSRNAAVGIEENEPQDEKTWEKTYSLPSDNGRKKDMFSLFRVLSILELIVLAVLGRRATEYLLWIVGPCSCAVTLIGIQLVLRDQNHRRSVVIRMAGAAMAGLFVTINIFRGFSGLLTRVMLISYAIRLIFTFVFRIRFKASPAPECPERKKREDILLIVSVLVLVSAMLVGWMKMYILEIMVANIYLAFQNPMNCKEIVLKINKFLATLIDAEIVDVDGVSSWKLASGGILGLPGEYATLQNACKLLLPKAVMLCMLVALCVMLIICLVRKNKADQGLRKNAYRTADWTFILLLVFLAAFLVSSYVIVNEFYSWITIDWIN